MLYLSSIFVAILPFRYLHFPLACTLHCHRTKHNDIELIIACGPRSTENCMYTQIHKFVKLCMKGWKFYFEHKRPIYVAKNGSIKFRAFPLEVIQNKHSPMTVPWQFNNVDRCEQTGTLTWICRFVLQSFILVHAPLQRMFCRCNVNRHTAVAVRWYKICKTCVRCVRDKVL